MIKTYRNWAPDETATLARMTAEGVSPAEIARCVGRSLKAVMAKIHKIRAAQRLADMYAAIPVKVPPRRTVQLPESRIAAPTMARLMSGRA